MPDRNLKRTFISTLMNKKHSLQAFSIVEAIVGMAVAAIIMGMTFFIFSIITERMLDFKAQNQIVNDFNRLTYSINKDIFDSEKMALNTNQVTFKGYSGEEVNYYFQEDFSLRIKESFIDTFAIKLNSIRLDSVKSSKMRKVYLKLKMNVIANDSALDLNFYKRVYANELLKRK